MLRSTPVKRYPGAREMFCNRMRRDRRNYARRGTHQDFDAITRSKTGWQAGSRVGERAIGRDGINGCGSFRGGVVALIQKIADAQPARRRTPNPRRLHLFEIDFVAHAPRQAQWIGPSRPRQRSGWVKLIRLVWPVSDAFSTASWEAICRVM